MGQTDRELVVHLRTAHRESRGHLRQSSADRRPPATGATAGSPACCSFLAGGLAGKTIEHRCHQGRESTGVGEQGLCRHLASADHTHMIGRILSKFPAQFDYSTVSRMALAMESLCKLSVASLLLPACCAGRLCRWIGRTFAINVHRWQRTRAVIPRCASNCSETWGDCVSSVCLPAMMRVMANTVWMRTLVVLAASSSRVHSTSSSIRPVEMFRWSPRKAERLPWLPGSVG